jgi:hypothetical protein
VTTSIDGHVHVHPEFGIDAVLSAAARRFAADSGAPEGVLCLTESAGIDAFDRLRRHADGGGSGDVGEWSVRATREGESVRCERRDGALLFVLAGCQVVAAEDLEVLALATTERWSDGAPFLDLVAHVCDSGAVAVVPWGFGKWWGRRGRLVRAAFEAHPVERLFAGDNGGRWHPAGAPRLLRELRSRGYRVIPGSDPLPLPGQLRRVGGAGLRVGGRPDPDRPAAWLRALLQDRATEPVPFGGGVGLTEFVGSQVRMQLRKRGRAAA